MFKRLSFVAFLSGVISASAQPFQLPTANNALFDPDGGAERFFVPTVGKTWPSGCFGCVRSDGWQLHEGLDIRCLQRDKKNEPIDPVLATASGTVSYINRKPSLSNYGNYIVLQHVVEGLEVYSVYAHLREIRSDLRPGNSVKAGETIGIMGRTANTREGISKERAHVHFELNLLINDRFASWYKKTFPGQRNDHGNWNGQNLLGIDPRAIFLAQKQLGEKFSLTTFLQRQQPLCRVFVRETQFPWLNRYATLVRPNPQATRDGIVGYEMVLNFMGMPIELTPRSAAEIKGKARVQLLSVDEAEYQRNPCRKLVTKRSGKWELANNGIHLINLLTY